MKSRTFFALALAVLAATGAHAVELSLVASSVGVGDNVQVSIKAAGTVLLESDFSLSSTELEVLGEKTVDVGPAKGPGVYLVRARQGKEWAPLVVLVTPADGKLALEALTGQFTAREVVPDSLAAKYFGGFTVNRLQKAIKTAAVTWGPQNIVGVTTIVLICPIGFLSGAGVAVCAGPVGSKALDFSEAVLTTMADLLVQENVLTPEEAKTIKLGISVPYLMVKLYAPESYLDKLLEAVEFGATQTFSDNPELIFGVKFSKDLKEKAEIAIEIIKK
jgi:hypothetical protein